MGTPAFLAQENRIDCFSDCINIFESLCIVFMNKKGLLTMIRGAIYFNVTIVISSGVIGIGLPLIRV